MTPVAAAQRARDAGIRIYGVALGTPQGKLETDYGPQSTALPVPPDAAAVRAIARITHGRAFTARTAARLDTVYENLGSSIGRKVERREIGSWFAAASALLLIGGVGFSRLWGAPLP
jgi:Ca-activated chloride channel family protein